MHKLSLILTVVVASVAASALLAEGYAWIARVCSLEVWVAAAALHSVFACVAVYLLLKHRIKFLDVRKQQAFLAYTPTIAIIGVTVLVALTTRTIVPGGSEAQDLTPDHLSWVLWIPVVEELTFRVLFGAFYRARFGILWGSYASAVFFSVMHSFPILQRWLSGDVGVTLGPLLLGLICEYLWVKSGRLMPIIFFHAACNMTVPLFLKIDQRWLSWLGMLYQ